MFSALSFNMKPVKVLVEFPIHIMIPYKCCCRLVCLAKVLSPPCSFILLHYSRLSQIWRSNTLAYVVPSKDIRGKHISISHPTSEIKICVLSRFLEHDYSMKFKRQSCGLLLLSCCKQIFLTAFNVIMLLNYGFRFCTFVLSHL